MSVPPRVRFLVLRRDNWTCRYCGAKASGDTPIEVDHKQPRSAGGTDDLWNLVAACFRCNRGKGELPLDPAAKETRKKSDEWFLVRAENEYGCELARRQDLGDSDEILPDSFDPLYERSNLRWLFSNYCSRPGDWRVDPADPGDPSGDD